MALDIGDRTVGIALSDETGTLASPLMTLDRRNARIDAARIGGLVKEHGVRLLVAGLPLGLDGSEGPQAMKVRAFVRRLEVRAGAPIVWRDERLTTIQAERVLIASDLSRARRRKVIDQAAAVLILQSFLDSGSGREDGAP